MEAKRKRESFKAPPKDCDRFPCNFIPHGKSNPAPPGGVKFDFCAQLLF
jgi:hypothetical protein